MRKFKSEFVNYLESGRVDHGPCAVDRLKNQSSKISFYCPFNHIRNILHPATVSRKRHPATVKNMRIIIQPLKGIFCTQAFQRKIDKFFRVNKLDQHLTNVPCSKYPASTISQLAAKSESFQSSTVKEIESRDIVFILRII